MTGKELKDFAAQVHDDAIVEMKTGTSTYGSWEREFQLQAPYVWMPAIVRASTAEEA